MNLLHALHTLLGQHIQQQGLNGSIGRALNQNQLQVAPPNHTGAQLGIGDIGGNVQGGQYNPGATPVQGSYPVLPAWPGQATPQYQSYRAGEGIQAFRHMNPQLKDTGYFWNQ